MLMVAALSPDLRKCLIIRESSIQTSSDQLLHVFCPLCSPLRQQVHVCHHVGPKLYTQIFFSRLGLDITEKVPGVGHSGKPAMEV